MSDHLTDYDLTTLREMADTPMSEDTWEGDIEIIRQQVHRLLDEVERLRTENNRLSIALDHGQEASDAAFDGLRTTNCNLAMLVLLLRERVERLGGTVEDIDFRAGGDAKTLIAMREERDRYHEELERLRTGTGVQRLVDDLSDDELREDLERIAHEGAGEYVADLAVAAIHDELRRRATNDH